MAFFVALPPTEHISESAEVRRLREEQVRVFRDAQKKNLQVQKQNFSTLAKGGFRGTEIAEWGGKFNAIVYTAFVYPASKKQSAEWLRLSALVRQADCVLMGASWEWQGELPKGFPAELKKGGVTFAEARERTFEKWNPYRFEPGFSGAFAKRGEYLLGIIAGETIAAAGIPALSGIGRAWCDAVFSPEFGPSTAALYPARAHRVLKGQWEFRPRDLGLAWPEGRGAIWISSGTFGERKNTVYEQKDFAVFTPAKMAQEIVKKLIPETHKITEQSFSIIKREGRWVYLNRGRAFGLEIGMHLVARGAKLHVIQFAPEEKEHDVAIALVRNEDAAAPLKAGDTVTMDLTQFPKK
jgi:hypothetical protein